MLLLAAAALAACNATKHLPSGAYLLTKNQVEIEKEPELPKEDQITKLELDKYIRQQPNKRFLGTNLPIWIYSQADTAKNNGWNRFKRRLGAAPVLLDSAQTALSAGGMKIYMDSKGFLDSEVIPTVDTADRKAQVTYHARQGEPFRIGTIRYDFRDRFVKAIILSDTANTLLHTGNIFDANVLDNERARITNFLKNQGYYNFSINNISYVADSTVGGRRIDLTVLVKQYMAGYDTNGEAVLDNNRIYRIRDINVFPDYNPTVATTDSLYKTRLDTVRYRGLNIIYDTKQHVRSEILRRTISLYPNALYSAQDVKRTYDNIMRLGYYKSASILFTEVADSTQKDNFISFVGTDSTGSDEADYTAEHYLSCEVLCTPALRQSYSVNLEGTTSADYFGVMAKVGYQNRNLLRGVELFEVNVRGGYEFMYAGSKYKSDAYEFGVSTSFSFPRLLTPFRVNRYNHALNPRTRIDLSYNTQKRPYYHRDLASAVWGYSWGKGRSTFALRPIDLTMVNMRWIDDDFFADLPNPYLRNSYTSQLIAGLSGSYLYTNQQKNANRGSIALRFNFETNGNLFNGLYRLFDIPPKGYDEFTQRSYYKLLSIRYAQYFRTDLSFVKNFWLGQKSALVYRFFGGFGYAYGNSTSLPFERLFYCGGSNSMRGWLARTLGPGGDPKRDFSDYPSQLANFKLETNLEARFPVWGILQGALFFDLGNIWFMNQGGTEETRFKIDRFYKQLGFNTGLGARFDFGFFVFRLDWGIKLHNPNEPAGERWIQHFRLKNTTLNFGVGYPF